MALTTTDYRGNKIRLIQKKWQSLSVAMNTEKYEQPDAEAAIKCYKKQSQRAMNSIQQTI